MIFCRFDATFLARLRRATSRSALDRLHSEIEDDCWLITVRAGDLFSLSANVMYAVISSRGSVSVSENCLVAADLDSEAYSQRLQDASEHQRGRAAGLHDALLFPSFANYSATITQTDFHAYRAYVNGCWTDLRIIQTVSSGPVDSPGLPGRVLVFTVFCVIF